MQFLHLFQVIVLTEVVYGKKVDIKMIVEDWRIGLSLLK